MEGLDREEPPLRMRVWRKVSCREDRRENSAFVEKKRECVLD